MQTDTGDFQVIYDEFHARILRYMQRMVGDAEAEDLAQEAFAKVAGALPGFRGDAQLSTWIYRIATNTALDRLRALPRSQTLELDEAEDELPDQNIWTGEHEPTPEAQVYRNEMSECIRGFVMLLPESYRTVMLLADYEGLANQQIAEVLDITLETVKIRLHRARERLKAELIAHCGPEWIESNEFLPELK